MLAYPATFSKCLYQRIQLPLDYMTYSIDTQIKYIGIPLVNNGLRDRNRMVVDLNLPMQSVHITTKVVGSNYTRYNII